MPAPSFGNNLGPHRTAKHLRANIRRTQAGGAIKAKSALNVVQLQSRFADLQACAFGGKIHLHQRRLPSREGNIQLQQAAQLTLTFPAGEGLLHT